MARQRLQKILARAGLASRRKCEELILEGRVTVDGELVTRPGLTVDPREQEIRCDGVPLKPQKLAYILLYKLVYGYVIDTVRILSQIEQYLKYPMKWESATRVGY